MGYPPSEDLVDILRANFNLKEAEVALALPTRVSPLIQQAKVIAVAHCPCRITANLGGRGCEPPTEVCMKFDDLAE